MNRSEPERWTPEIENDLRRLGREPRPPAQLEERVVTTLRRQGLLARRGRRKETWWIAAAASLVLVFGVGYVSGLRAGTQATASLAHAFERASAAERAVLVQRTASEHVAALAALGELQGESAEAAREQGREAALVALYASTLELAKIDPQNESVRRILDVLAASLDLDAKSDTTAAQVIWF